MSFETDFAKAYAPLLKKLSVKEAQLKKLLLASLKNPTTSAAAWNSLRQEVNVIYGEMNVLFSAWSKSEIPASYKKSLASIQAAIDANKKILVDPIKTVNAMLTSKNTLAISGLLAQEAGDTFLSALNAGNANVIRWTRVTQQVMLTESEINLALLTGLRDAGDLGAAARTLRGEFWKKMLDNINNEQFIQAGRYRYTPKYYAEMVARTKFHEAQSMAAMAQAKNYDTDLVQISNHNTKTDICIPYEGNIYSISGTDKKFPPLNDTPPYHPNCLHLMWPTFESALEIDWEKEVA